MAAVLSGCRAAPPTPGWTPAVLTPDQLDLLGQMVDRIIPATDTPEANAYIRAQRAESATRRAQRVCDRRSVHDVHRMPKNPSLTYMALTARACDYAVEASKRMEL